MDAPDPADVFCACPPGLEPVLAGEIRGQGFAGIVEEPGGVACTGGWEAAMRANLWLRCASRVLLRVAAFRAPHLAQLDKRARRIDWAGLIGPAHPVRVEATCRASRIYHAGAAAQRVARAIADATSAPVAETGGLRVLARIDDDLCTLSLDTSGAPLHQRRLKEAVGKAPLRETLAAAFLCQCGFDGLEPVADPMCGSGTFLLEAAAIAAGLAPGRARRFAFEDLRLFEGGPLRAKWDALKADATGAGDAIAWRGTGADRDDGAIRNATENAARAGVGGLVTFTRAPVSAFTPPEGPPGLVTVNPPYGARIGNRKLLFALYGSLGAVLQERFSGWRVGLVTSDAGLARATGLRFEPSGAPVAHGGLKVTLWQTGRLP